MIIYKRQLMQPGTILILNGTSSSGKTTLIRMLQGALDQPFLELGLDKLIWMLPKRYFSPPLWDEVLGKADQAGEYGHKLVHGMHRAIRSLAENGLNILADHVLIEPDWVIDCANQLCHLPAYLIGIHCELQILEQREANRKDRTLGQARRQFHKVHSHGIYDFTIDSSESTPEENIAQILAFLKSSPPPKALKQLGLKSQLYPG